MKIKYMNAKTKEFIAGLRRMRVLIEQGWVQGSFAIDAEGRAVWPLDHRAVAFCMRGAADRAKVPHEPALVFPTGRVDGFAEWNDNPKRTQAEVLACIDNSIAALTQA
jgi:hypothetical protein